MFEWLTGPSNSKIIKLIKRVTLGIQRKLDSLIGDNENQHAEISEALQRIEHQLQGIAHDVLIIKSGLYRPKAITLITTGEKGMDTITFDAQLPEAPADLKDIVGGQLTVTIGDKVLDPISTPVTGKIQSNEFEGAEGTAGNLSFRYRDNANNLSDPSTLDFVLTDSVAPPQPGMLGIVTTGEKHSSSVPPVETPTDPAPPVEEPVTPPTEETPVEDEDEDEDEAEDDSDDEDDEDDSDDDEDEDVAENPNG